jgi:hypothetical protein
MGWAARERIAREAEEGVHTFAVKQWTAFEWVYPEGKGKAVQKQKTELRKDRTDHLKRAASMIERQLLHRCGSMDPRVKQVSVKREPQLLFEFTVRATDKDDAMRKARYWLRRGLQTRVPTGKRVPVRDRTGKTSGLTRPERVALRPPWGKHEVTQAAAPTRRRRKEAA